MHNDKRRFCLGRHSNQQVSSRTLSFQLQAFIAFAYFLYNIQIYGAIKNPTSYKQFNQVVVKY